MDYFLDPVGGNDANDGLSFANRKKTVSAFNAALLSPGDTVRIIASPDPTNPGNATWTDNSGTVTWAAAKNKVIDDCETNWTAATNVTCALSTARVKQGSNGQTITPGSAFTTGKMAYRTLPVALDLSAYEQVSLWVRYGSLTSAGQMELKLCSDTTGDTAVNTLALPAGTNGQWRVCVLDNAAALGASIASIALYATADPGTTAINLDNIVACKAASSADCVTHEHVIGKNTGGEPDWYSILSIADDSVVIGGAYLVEVGSSSNAPRPYRGTTETVATYLLRGLEGWATSPSTVADSGTDGNRITFSGGWNRTDMSTQTGVTYLQGSHFLAGGIGLGTRDYITVEKVGGLNYTSAIVIDSGGDSPYLDLEQAVGCANGAYYSTSQPFRSQTIIFDAIQGMTNAAGYQGAANANGRIEVQGRRIHGQCANSTAAALTVYGGFRYAIDKIDNNPGYGATLANMTVSQTAQLIGTTFANNALGDFAQGGHGVLFAEGCTFSAPSFTDGYIVQIRSTRHGGTATDHRIYARHWRLATATDQRHTASGVSWKVSPISATECSSDKPAQFSLAKVAVNSGALVTIKCWLRRDNTGISAGIRIPANALPGVGASDLQTLMTAAIDTWEEITLTFTPTVAGVVEVQGVAWGGSTYNAWFDDLTITQA